MLCAKNRPIGQAEFASADASAYTGLAAILKSLCQFVRHEPAKESRGGEGMSDTATWPRPVFIPHIIEHFSNPTRTCRMRSQE